MLQWLFVASPALQLASLAAVPAVRVPPPVMQLREHLLFRQQRLLKTGNKDMGDMPFADSWGFPQGRSRNTYNSFSNGGYHPFPFRNMPDGTSRSVGRATTNLPFLSSAGFPSPNGGSYPFDNAPNNWRHPQGRSRSSYSSGGGYPYNSAPSFSNMRSYPQGRSRNSYNSGGGYPYNNGGGFPYNNGGGFPYNNGGGFPYNNGGGFPYNSGPSFSNMRSYPQGRSRNSYANGGGYPPYPQNSGHVYR